MNRKPDPEIVDTRLLDLLLRHDDARPQTTRELHRQLAETMKRSKVEVGDVAESLSRLEHGGLVKTVDISLYERGYVHARRFRYTGDGGQ